MKFHISLVLAFMVGITPSVRAFNKVIYGTDSRVDAVYSTNVNYINQSMSTAARIQPETLILKDGLYSLVGQTLEKRMNVCSDEEFSKQLSISDCSGFLVGDDLLVTAGHCARDAFDCATFKWVFDYRVNGNDSAISIPESSVYSCKEIVQQKLSRNTQEDFALIRLDRKVTGRTPLKFRTEGKISDDANLVVIGYPTGLPVKIADGANVRDNSKDVFFTANLDSFGGSSGSPVINSDTGVVEGILVRGESDYVYDYWRKCRQVKRCEDDACRGEDITRITKLSKLMEVAQQ